MATLVILYDLSRITQLSLGEDQSSFGSERRRLEGMAWSGVGCFVLEFVGLFAGISMFLPLVNCFYIALHFLGLVLVAHVCIRLLYDAGPRKVFPPPSQTDAVRGPGSGAGPS